MSKPTGREVQRPETLFLVDTLNMLEALGNLNHLIECDAGDADAVHCYVSQSEDILRRLAGLVRARHNK